MCDCVRKSPPRYRQFLDRSCCVYLSRLPLSKGLSFAHLRRLQPCRSDMNFLLLSNQISLDRCLRKSCPHTKGFHRMSRRINFCRNLRLVLVHIQHQSPFFETKQRIFHQLSCHLGYYCTSHKRRILFGFRQ